MTEVFKTVLVLSLLGFGITALLLLLKPITAKRFPAKWQYYVWIAVLFSMIIPVYKMIPQKEAQKLSPISQKEITEAKDWQENVQRPRTEVIAEKTDLKTDVPMAPRVSMHRMDLLSYIWFFGMCIYLVVVVSSYIIYLIRKRKKAITVTENEVLDAVKNELKIKRHIKIRMSNDFESPMLVGVLFPVIYLPSRDLPDENMRMVFRHELTHYKRKDLLIKWFSLFVNAVHWFNPLSYLLCANVGEACEISCDMAVTKNMSDSEQKIYMKTILDLAQ